MREEPINIADKPVVKSIFSTLFVRYGSGSGVFLPITQAKAWNVIAWSLIVVGTLAWGVALFVWNF